MMHGLDLQTLAARCTDEEAVKLYDALQILADEERKSKFQNLFPDTGPYRRELYPKHLEFFRVGATYRERLLMAANRFGKTIAAGYEVARHLLGDYPEWWEGRRFNRPIEAWVAGDTNETTRDIIQKTLLGDVAWNANKKGFDGCGIVPQEAHGSVRWKQGIPDMCDYVEVQHKTGQWSRLAFKSYDQGRRAFQGTAKDLIWLDEECPMDVYGECLIRTATTNGIIMVTFTPLLGMSELVRSFLQPDMGEVTDAFG